jgi:sugar lactone lactonase YvrE
LRNFLQYLFIAIALTSVFNHVNAQAPVISYSPSTNIYTVGTVIPTLTPLNTGGAVPATTYGTVTTLVAVGSGAPQLVNSQAITVDGAGNVYIADDGNNLIRKITPAGVMTTLAGSGATGELDGTGAAAKFNAPDGITYDGSGNLYVSDAGGCTIRKIVIATGVVTTYAGTGVAGHANNATLLTSTFNGPAGLKFDASGNLYIADQGNNLVREISGTTVSTLAGGGSVGGTAAGSANGTGTAATFNQLNDVAPDASGNLFVADYANNLIRKIVISTKVVTTYAGTGAGGSTDNAVGTSATFNRPGGICIDPSGNFLIADQNSQKIRMVSSTGTAAVTTIAGSGTQAETNGVGTAAAFNDPIGVIQDNQGNGYVVDFLTATTGSVRKIILTGYTITPALPAGLTFNVTTGAISGNPTAISPATNYTITGYNASGSSSTVVSIACGVTVDWTAGSNTTAWATGPNWSSGSVPGVNDQVRIGVVAYTNAKEPSITVANVTVGSITFGSVHAGTLTVGTLQTLTVSSALTVNTGATGTLTGTGTGAVNISPGATVNVTGTGKLVITSPLNFTLKSDATGSASIGQVLTTSISGTGAGAINVERYITGGAGYRGYRLLSSPVYNAIVAPNNVYSINYVQNSVFLTGSAGGGFDKAGNPTLYLFREDQAPSNTSFTSGNFWGISAINNLLNYNYYMNGGAINYNIPVGNGYMMFFRGNRASALVGVETVTTYVPVAVALTASGTLNTGQVIVHDWYTPASANLGWTNATANTAIRGYNLVGNPYASSIDWEQYNTTTPATGIYANNVGITIYELNPATNNYDSYQKGGAFTNHGSRTIVSGQAFFVIAANNTSPQLIFNESAKAVAPYAQNTGLNLFMATRADMNLVNNADIDQHLRLQMLLDDVHTDDIYIGFNSAAQTQYVYDEDAPYKQGTGKVALASISSDNVPLAINKMPLPKQSQTIPLKINAAADGVYHLNMIDLKGIPQLFDIWLMDRYKNDSLDIRHNTTYAFNLYKADTNSYGSTRFQLVIRQNQALAMHLLDFAAAKATNGAQITWKTENEQNYTNFTVERSTDNGATFDVLGGFASSAQGTYSFRDPNPLVAADEYRLKLVDLNGSVSYSKVITLMYSGLNNTIAKSNINVYPNPASSVINLTINQNGSSSSNSPLIKTANSTLGQASSPTISGLIYGIKIINNMGSVIKTATSSQANWQDNVSNLLPGTYIIQVVNNSNKSVIGKSTFVKL